MPRRSHEVRVEQKSTHKFSVLVPMVVSATVAIILSLAMTYLAMAAVFGPDPHALAPVARVKRFGLFAAAIIPLIISPAMTFRFARLIAALDRTRSDLYRLAHTDQLTSLLNRRGFDIAAQAALESARSAGRPTAVLMCDIDNFKALNDRFGHSLGDKALVHVAKAIEGISQGRAFVAGRQGGDEFAVMLPAATREEAHEIATSLRAACAKAGVDSEIHAATVSLSVGVAISRYSRDSFTALMSRADAALYECKRHGA
jgi:diguanylate cyclase (GGDEF)-like protein